MKQGSQALRKGRFSSTGNIYHIRFSTEHRTPLIDFNRGSKIAKKLYTNIAQADHELLCWVLMPDHVHLLIRLGDSDSLKNFVRQLKSSTSRLFPNITPFWQSGYFDRAIRREEDVVSVARYIVANPVRAGLVDRVGKYSLWNAIWF